MERKYILKVPASIKHSRHDTQSYVKKSLLLYLSLRKSNLLKNLHQQKNIHRKICIKHSLFGLIFMMTVTICLQIPLISQQLLLKTTTGNVIDLISNDVQRMELAPRWICTALLPVFEFVTVVILLLYFIGWQAIIGILFLMTVIPCIMVISGVCAQLRQETAEVTDRRISLMNELVSGIRAVKAHAWEENYREKVQEVRR